MIRTAIAALVVLVVIVSSGAPFTPAAHAATTIDSTTIENNYPKSLSFKVTATADVDITDVTLSYAITGRNSSALGKPESLTPAKTLTATVVVDVNSGQSYIPVGSEFKYTWQITTSDGQVMTSPQQTFLFLPPEQQWKSVTGDFMIIHFHGDREALADQYLKAGLETFDKVGKNLFNIQLQQVPIRVILFANEAESNLARPGAAQSRFDAAVTTCGTKVTNDILLMIPISCGSSDVTDTLRHELGHILNSTAGESTLVKLPSWLDEGTAVYAQSSPGSGYSNAFQQAARSNRLIPFAEMATASSNSQTVNLFYGQSYFMVKYLIDKLGPAKYAEFFSTMKGGRRFDQALQQVYGFDVAGFEKEFIAANGGTAPGATATAPAQQAQPTQAAPTSRPANAAPTATRTPAAASQVTSGGDDDGFDRVAIGAMGAALMFALFAFFFFLLANMLGSNKPKVVSGPPGPPPPPPVTFERKDD